MKLFLGFARQAFHDCAMYRLEFWMQVLSNCASCTGPSGCGTRFMPASLKDLAFRRADADLCHAGDG